MKKNEKVLTLCNLLIFRQRVAKETDTTSLKIIRQIAYLMSGNPNLAEMIIFASDINDLKEEIKKEAIEVGFAEQFAEMIINE